MFTGLFCCDRASFLLDIMDIFLLLWLQYFHGNNILFCVRRSLSFPLQMCGTAIALSRKFLRDGAALQIFCDIHNKNIYNEN
jgi:hypothetical protein